MDQDGNTAMPQKPDFSSSNSTDVNQQQIAAAAASMTESDPKQAITSAPSNNGAPAHGMFGNRRFRAKKDATPTSFAGAPDFFNQAASENQDFVAIGDAPAPSNKKRFAIIGIILVAVIGAVAAVFLLNPTKFGGGGNADFSKEEKQKIVELYYDYRDMMYAYHMGNDKPEKELAGSIDGRGFTLVSSHVLSDYDEKASIVRADLEEARKISSNNQIAKEKRENLDKGIDGITQKMTVIEKNLGTVKKFITAFDEPAKQLMTRKKTPSDPCELSEEAKQLSEGDTNISKAAKSYSEAYCKLNSLILSGDDYRKVGTIAEFMSAKKALAGIIEDVSSIDVNEDFFKAIAEENGNENED